MTLLDLTNSMNEFYTEYSSSRDPDVMKLCSYIRQVSASLNNYNTYLTRKKATLEQNQETYASYIETLNQILGVTVETDGLTSLI